MYKPCRTCGNAFLRHHHGNEWYCSKFCKDNAKKAKK
jgi:hypothetical protein